MKRIFTLLVLTLGLTMVKAQIYYDFTTANPTTNSYSNITAGPITQGNNNGTTPVITTTSPSSGYTGASGGGNAGAAANTGGFNPATSTYFEITLTPTAGNSVVLTGISFGSRSTSTGPQAASLRTSVDAFATDQATFILANNSTWTLYSSSLNVTGVAGSPVTIRLYGYNGTGSPSAGTANWRIDDFTINPNITFPLNLTTFKASLANNQVQLNWASLNEQNVQSFVVERSVDGRTYSGIGQLSANNNSQSSYSFVDNSPADGVNYYRLKMTDKDGGVKYSTIVTISNRAGLKAQIFPNPTFGNISVSHLKAQKAAAIRILNGEGKQVKVYTVETGAIQTSLNIGELPKGNYILIFENDGDRAITKFVKQ